MGRAAGVFMLFTRVFCCLRHAKRFAVVCVLVGFGAAAMADKTAPPAAVTPPAANTTATDVLADKRINPRTPPAPATVVPTAQDPLGSLQEKLAARLATRMATAEAKDGSELRVVARPAKGAAMVVKPESGVRARMASSAVTKTNGSANGSPAQLWSYDGVNGPQAWAQLKSEYAACGKGDRQSPIDVRDGIKVQLEPVQFHYPATHFRVIDDGRTVRVLVAAGSSIEVMGQRYELKHLQFHRPSEVHLNGKVFDMAVHLVHQDTKGRSAIVAVQLERGSAHSVVQAVWNNLPLEKGVEQAARSPLDLLALLPVDPRYATFMGSMTAPPCQEGVLWVVMKQPVGVSDYQIEVFSRLYPMNARPLQAANGRMVKESE
jgi:carbonic anhydrase